MPDNRRESDRVLPLILQRMDRADELADDRYNETRQRQDERHRENTQRLDALAGIRPMVERHDAWIETDGKMAVKKTLELDTRISNAQIQVTSGYRGLKLGLMLGGSGAFGAAVVKVAGLIASAIPH